MKRSAKFSAIGLAPILTSIVIAGVDIFITDLPDGVDGLGMFAWAIGLYFLGRTHEAERNEKLA